MPLRNNTHSTRRPVLGNVGPRMKAKAKRQPAATQPHSRPPLERMMRIHQAIAGGKYPNASTLAREIEVVPKTIHRDIEFMRDRLQLPVAYDDR